MRTVHALRHHLVFLAVLSGSASPAVAQPAPAPFAILDNSFLVEEAFNQERGVVQNIFSWTRLRSGEWVASFTQEWPVFGSAHQLSYTIPFSRQDGSTGLNDILVNYRYQLLEERAGRPAVAPRASLIFPTGDSINGFGDGAIGLQLNLPLSKQVGDLYLHGNVGTTWLPGVSRIDLVGGSAIWRVGRMLHVMFESIAAVGESFIVSPGFRRGWDVGDSQIVVGLAVPITFAGDERKTSLLTYVSYELPFRATR
jgi:hypothetical protein